MNLKVLRKSEGLTQKDLADMLKVAKTTYCGYELGTSEPTIETLIKLADYYNVSLDYLVGRDFKNEVGFLTKAEADFVKAFLALSESNKNKLFTYTVTLLAAQ